MAGSGSVEETAQRRRLIGVAYRLLGSLAEAEDAVQEVYVRWYALPDEQRQVIDSPAAWLTRVVSRVCLDMLGSARARRERYVGPWLPEPLPADATKWTSLDVSEKAAADPLERVSLEESSKHRPVDRARKPDAHRTGGVRPARRLRLPVHRDRRDHRQVPRRLPSSGIRGPASRPCRSPDSGLVAQDAVGRALATVSLALRGRRISDIWVVRNPDKLKGTTPTAPSRLRR